MEKINFSVSINAPKEKVWETLWDLDSYRKWTNAFHEGSYAETDNWKQGSKVLFLGPGGSGMVAIVEVNRPNEYMSFHHIGMIDKGVEDTTSDQVKAWSGAHENYSLKETNGITELTVDMDITEEYKEMFSQMWPKALKQVKELAEN